MKTLPLSVVVKIKITINLTSEISIYTKKIKSRLNVFKLHMQLFN